MPAKISVLMPIYRTPEAYLRMAIESILSQTYKDFEFLILDDCPEYNQSEIVKSYHDPRIIYLINEKNMGISEARNKLIDMAKGEYLAVMDHDDISMIRRFEREVAYLDAHPDVGVVGCWARVLGNNLFFHRPENDRDIKAVLTKFSAVLHPTSMIRKSVLMENNIRYEKRYSPAEDYCLWVRLLECTKFHNVREILFRYRRHEHNTTTNQLSKMQDAGEELRYMVRKKHPELYARVKKMYSYRWSLFGSQRLAFGGYQKEHPGKIVRPAAAELKAPVVLDKPILVIAHVFYPKLWPELKKHIQNISPYPFDLYVTLVEEHPDIQADIKATFPTAHIEIVENRGYDIGPFIHTLSKIDLEKYDFVIKVHTKRTRSQNWRLCFRGLYGNKWRKALLAFLKDHDTLTRYLNSFKCADLGMTGNYKCLVFKDYYLAKPCVEQFRLFLEQKKMFHIDFSFVGGTMFLCRANVLRPIQNLKLKLTDFGLVGEDSQKAAQPYVVERLIGFYPSLMGYRCEDYVVPKWKQRLFYFMEEDTRVFVEYLREFIKNCLLKSDVICKNKGKSGKKQG